MKKILVIGYVWPEPCSSAAGSHILSILRLYIQQGWEVEFATPSLPTEHMIDLSKDGITSQRIALNCDSFDAYISQLDPDIVMFDRFMMEEQFGWRVDKCCPKALKILDTEDLQCLRNARKEALKVGRELMLMDLFSDLAKREIAAIYRCDLSLIISNYEMDLLIGTFKVDSSLLHYLPFMIEQSNIPDITPSFSVRKNFMSIGNFRHAPNWDMVLYLRKAWPLIREKIPHAELHIYGSYPTPKAVALDNPGIGFLVKGWAENAYAVMQECRLCLSPIRFGAGIKGKLLDAMVTKTPSITSSIGSEGMCGDEPWPGAIADSLQDFVDAAIKLYLNENEWLNAQARCLPLLKARYDAKEHAALLINKLHELEESLEDHRLKNFTGAMLKHHTMASTKYMSQWIAEKNSKNL